MKRRFTLLLWILIVGTVAPLAETLFIMNADKAREEASFGTASLIRRAQEQMAETRQFRLDSLKEQLVGEVTFYIKKVAPTSYDALPAYMVDQCLDNDLDICFMLSQTQLETCFGTLGMGRAQSRYSMFGVSRRYTSYENCIADYVALLKSNYLVNGRTEQDLMKNYVNNGGFRYASSPTYEEELTATYKRVVKDTNIRSLQQQYEAL